MNTPKPSRTWRRSIARWLAMLGFVYVAVVVLLMLEEDQLVFMARPASAGWVGPGKLQVEDVRLTSADDTKLHAWWVPVEGGEGAILFCHGQAGNLSSRGDLMERLKKLGKPILIFDYPGYGHSEGVPSEAGCYAAGDAAYDWLVKEKKIPPSRIILMGKSLGGGIATDIASRCGAASAVLSAGRLADAQSLRQPVEDRPLSRPGLHRSRCR
jgi:pimeloyl-ACP methyl ester carboxylesterase